MCADNQTVSLLVWVNADDAAEGEANPNGRTLADVVWAVAA